MLHLITRYGKSYVVNSAGMLTQEGNTFSGQWKLLGIQHVKRNEFIPFAQLTPDKLRSIQLSFKNGYPQYTVRDLDYGTVRVWGNTHYHGIASLWIDK